MVRRPMTGLVHRNLGSPQTQTVVQWLKGGEWALLNLLLLTRQSAGYGAVNPKRNELPSFRERQGLSIVPNYVWYLVSTYCTLDLNWQPSPWKPIILLSLQ